MAREPESGRAYADGWVRLRWKVLRALMSEKKGEVGFEGVSEGLGGVWKARVGVKVDLGSCLRVVVRAKGRRNTKAMVEP